MKRNGFKLLVCVLLTALALVGCSSLQQKAVTDSYAPTPSATYRDEGSSTNGISESSTYNLVASIVPQGIERKMIMTARIEITTDNVQGIEETMIQLVQGFGGHIQRSYFSNREGNQYWEFTLRIPTQDFESGIKDISALGKVQSSITNGQDVTEEYMDLAARLRVLQQEENRLLELLAKAVTIEDFLQVESHLSRVRVEIEQTTGRIKYLDNRLDFSTIELLIRPTQGMVAQELKGFAGLAQQMKAAFRRGINGVVGLITGTLVGIAALVPLLVFVVPAAWVLILLVKRKRNNRQPPQPPMSM